MKSSLLIVLLLLIAPPVPASGPAEQPGENPAPVAHALPAFRVSADFAAVTSEDELSDLFGMLRKDGAPALFLILDDMPGVVIPMLDGIRRNRSYSINLPPRSRVVGVMRAKGNSGAAYLVTGARNESGEWRIFSGRIRPEGIRLMAADGHRPEADRRFYAESSH